MELSSGTPLTGNACGITQRPLTLFLLPTLLATTSPVGETSSALGRLGRREALKPFPATAESQAEVGQAHLEVVHEHGARARSEAGVYGHTPCRFRFRGPREGRPFFRGPRVRCLLDKSHQEAANA